MKKMSVSNNTYTEHLQKKINFYKIQLSNFELQTKLLLEKCDYLEKIIKNYEFFNKISSDNIKKEIEKKEKIVESNRIAEVATNYVLNKELNKKYCKNCDKHFSNNDDLIAHKKSKEHLIKLIGVKKNKFSGKCSKCNKKFKNIQMHFSRSSCKK